jgi:hypothetical protein
MQVCHFIGRCKDLLSIKSAETKFANATHLCGFQILPLFSDAQPRFGKPILYSSDKKGATSYLKG